MTTTRSARARRGFLLVFAFCLAALLLGMARGALSASDRQQTLPKGQKPVILDEPRAVEQALLKQAKTVPGRHAYLFAELTDKGPVPIHASNARERFSIGSGFKLFI